MLDKLGLLPFALQSLICPSRTSELLLLGLGCWFWGFACGVFTALILSPSLRLFLLRLLQLTVGNLDAGPGPGVHRLQRYLH